MVTIKLKELAQRLNKTISDIALETKLNRNTVTALFHNKVDGIKFETLERICKKYNVRVADLLVIEQPRGKVSHEELTYKQEASGVPLTCWPWLVTTDRFNKKFLDFGYGKCWLYACKDYMQAYWEKDGMDKLARHVYARYSNKEKLDEFFNFYLQSTQKLKKMYFEADYKVALNYSNQELIQYYDDLWQAYQEMWENGLFIDSFDPGYDQEKINEIESKYHFSKEELQVLTTADQMTFNSERIYELLKIVKKIKNKKLTDSQLKRFVAEDSDIKKYIKDFDYYLSNYAQIYHINPDDIFTEIKKYLKDDNLFDQEFYNLVNYTKLQQEKVSNILKKYKLQANPLYFFSLLTYWRENRKQVNLMGFHVFDVILDSLEKKTGIDKKYLKYLGYDEVSHVLKGTIDLDVLKQRREEGCIFMVENNDYQMLVAEQAASLRDDLEQRLTSQAEATIISGQVACQGYAKGIARIILNEKDFPKLKEGEILVTGMTRPEFVTIMKRAAGIVTNEGGITSHAAIVSRELGKPCIIGTGNATQLIKDGDLIEVRANHRTVRILS